MKKRKSLIPTVAVLIAILSIYALSLKALAEDDYGTDYVKDLQVVEMSILLPIAAPPAPRVARTMNVIITAYSSTESQTDSTPFITASNSMVRDGIIANNLLPFGTKVRIPELFGNKVFEVDDRMHSRKGDYHVDIWFSSTADALEFGAQLATMEVLAN